MRRLVPTGVVVGASVLGVMLAGTAAALAPSSAADEEGPPQADASVAATEVTMTPVGDANTFTVIVTNETTGVLPVALSVVEAGSSAGCTAAFSPATVPALDKPATISVFVPDACEFADDKLELTLTVGSTAFTITASTKDAVDPDWGQLWTFLWVFIAMVIGVFGIGGAVLIVLTRTADESWNTLPGLDGKWDFKDAWASNVTVLGGVLTGVIGSTSVVKAIIGEDADSVLAVSLVSVAIAAAFAAGGAVSYVSFKWDGLPTKTGVLFGGALVATGAIAEIWIIANTAMGLPQVTGPGDGFVVAGMVGTYALLAAYMINTTWTAFTTPAPAVTWDAAQPFLMTAVLKANTAGGHVADFDAVEDATVLVAAARVKTPKWPKADPAVVAAMIELRKPVSGAGAQLTADDIVDVMTEATPSSGDEPGDRNVGRLRISGLQSSNGNFSY